MGARVPRRGGGFLTPDEIRTRVAEARVAHLATIDRDGRPHLVPFTFVLTGDVVYSVVDRKPKSTTRLRRLANIDRDPRVTVLVDHYEDDWRALWWCRGHGIATVVLADDPEFDEIRDAVSAKYPQYLEEPPPGPAIRIEISGWTGWAAGEAQT